MVLNDKWNITYFYLCLALSPFQPAVEVPQYAGVSLLVEGAQIRRPRHSLPRQTVLSNAPLNIQFPSEHSSSEEVEMTHKSQKSCAVKPFCRSGKENQSLQEKKRQLISAAPKREREGRALVRNGSCGLRSCRSLLSEQTVVVHTDPRKKARCLAMSIGGNGATLVPRSLSFSLLPPCTISDCSPLSKPSHGSHNSRGFLPQSTCDPQHRTSTRTFSLLRGRLPALEVLSLRPNIVTGTIACHNPTFSTHSSFHRQELLHRSYRQITCKHKGKNKD